MEAFFREFKYEVLFSNLEWISKGLKLTLLGENIVMLDTLYAFNAVRIMSPKFRKKMNEILGDSLFFAIPYRDFLICWASNSPDTMNSQLRTMINEDYQKQDHPLTNCVFSLYQGEVSIDKSFR
jgi:hypothetical protein